MDKRKGKYVIRAVFGSSRIRFYFWSKKDALYFRKFWEIKAEVRKNV